MLTRKLPTLAIALACTSMAFAGPTPIVFVVRHAEKEASAANDPDLSETGQKRAAALARILHDAELTAIFTTEFKRTQQTAARVGAAAHVTPTVVPAKDIAGLVDKLRHLKDNALVVGHGNTIPDLFKALGLQAATNIPEDDYNELFVVIMNEQPQLVRLHYPEL